MTAPTGSAFSMFTDCFSADDIDAPARRTGFVKRTAKITGQIFLALVTFGVWSDAKTTLAQLAAKVTQWGEQLAVSPEALHQSVNTSARVFLQESSVKPWQKYHPWKKSVMIVSFPTLPQCLESTARALACLKVAISVLVPEGGRQKPEPKCKRHGTIKAVCVDMSLSYHGTFPITHISTKW